MAEQKQNEKTSEPKGGDLRQASPASSETSKTSHESSADYWREQDPKYGN